MENAPQDALRRQLALKLWLTATAEEPIASDMRRGELPIAQLNPRSAFEMADVIAGGPQMGKASGGKASRSKASNDGE